MQLVPVTDLKQWVYCQRIVYYRWVMPAVGKPTYKMKEARAAEDLIEGLEVRRSLKEYGLEGAQRRFNVWMSDPAIGLSGKVDLLLESEAQVAVVDFKLTAGEAGENHRMRLAGYSLLAGGATGRPAATAFLMRIPDCRVFPVAITEELRHSVLTAIKQIREMAATQICPEPTS